MESLLNYTDSDSESSDHDQQNYNQPPKKKRRKLPSLNKISCHLFNNNNNNKDENQDNKNDHQGKIRRFGHIDGNWSVHIHIAIHQQFNPFFNKISNIIIQNSDKHNKIHCMNEHHISLSICQPIKTFQIKDFVDSFTKLFKNDHNNNNNKYINPFNISMDGSIKFYSNDTNQRYFGAILINEGNENIIDLINVINSGMNKWGLKQYYNSPQPHVSFIWSLNEFNFKDKKLNELNDKIKQELTISDLTRTMSVDTIMIKIGHRKYKIKL